MCYLRKRFAEQFADFTGRTYIGDTGAFHSNNIVPYELRICTKCNWHCVQDEEHVLLDCPSPDLVDLRIQHHHLFRSPSRNSNRLRDFISQADTKGLALYVYECLECCA